MGRLREWEDPAPVSRMESIRRLQIGESISIASRVNLEYGLAENAIAKRSNSMGTAMSDQATKIQREFRGREYQVRTGQFMKDGNELFIVSVLTRNL